MALCDAYTGRAARAQARDRRQGRDREGRRASCSPAPGLDAVIVGTPDHLHKAMTIAALDAGKDVYVEKPMTYTVDEGLEIIAAVKRNNRVLQVGSQGVSSPLTRRRGTSSSRASSDRSR